MNKGKLCFVGTKLLNLFLILGQPLNPHVLNKQFKIQLKLLLTLKIKKIVWNIFQQTVDTRK